jgi:hypothetical protein
MTPRDAVWAFIAIATVTASAAWVIDTNNQPRGEK